jgi:GDPmannose 4,6-dehydratase
MSDTTALHDLLAHLSPDEIYHLAAVHHSTEENSTYSETQIRQRMVDTNFGSTQSLAFALLKSKVSSHLIFAASSQMYTASRHQHMVDETSPKLPSTFYGHTKAWSTDLLAVLRSEFGLRASTAILFNHESHLRRARYVSRKISLAAAAAHLKRPVSLDLLNVGARADWCSAVDTVRALHLMATAAEPADYIVASGELHSVRDMLDAAFGHVGLDWRQFATFRLDDEQPALCGDPRRLENALAWQRTKSFATTIAEMVDADIARGARPYS